MAKKAEVCFVWFRFMSVEGFDQEERRKNLPGSMIVRDFKLGQKSRFLTQRRLSNFLNNKEEHSYETLWFYLD